MEGLRHGRLDELLELLAILNTRRGLASDLGRCERGPTIVASIAWRLNHWYSDGVWAGRRARLLCPRALVARADIVAGSAGRCNVPLLPVPKDAGCLVWSRVQSHGPGWALVNRRE